MKFIETEDEPGVTYWTIWPDFTLKEVQEKEAAEVCWLIRSLFVE
jgi:hypothetical protein